MDRATHDSIERLQAVANVLMTTAGATLLQLMEDGKGQVFEALLEACEFKPERLAVKIFRVALADVERAVNELDGGEIKPVEPEALKTAASVLHWGKENGGGVESAPSRNLVGA